MEKIYIVNVHPMLLDDGLCWDLFYLTQESKQIKCLRIFNVEVSFLVARYPGLSLKQFMRYIQPRLTAEVRTQLRTDLQEGACFMFGHHHEYVEIIGRSPMTLNGIYKELLKDAVGYYKQLNVNKLSPYDRLFYDNTETPFRYTSTTLSVAKTAYLLACKYNVPLIGGAKIDASKLSSKYPMDELPNVQDIIGLNFTDLVNGAISRDDTVDFKNNMTMLSYDIETWNNGEDVGNPELERNFIFCIGVGIFNLVDQKPEKRFCIMSKTFTEARKEAQDDGAELDVKRVSAFGRWKALEVYGEYVAENPNDFTTYVFTNSEKDLLAAFIRVIQEYHPLVINGFNNFGFDDKYIYLRCKKYGLDHQLLQCYSPYDVFDEDPTSRDNLYNRFWFKPFRPEFTKFELKIDGQRNDDNLTVRSWLVHMVDVRKLMMKEDPRRFTQYGTSLNSMLETYDVKNPYTNSALSKTGLHIWEMFRRWEANENLYSIALYCCQDAWICGTLLIKRSKLTDLIEMANITNTMLLDSIYKADGQRVANTILGYAYNESFALMDTPYEHRQRVMEQRKSGKLSTRGINPPGTIVPLGGKQHDDRTIVGGEVRNVHAGRQWFIVALDYASMYPSAKEGSNLDSSARVDKDILDHPDKYGLRVVAKKNVNDIYGDREVYYIKKVE